MGDNVASLVSAPLINAKVYRHFAAVTVGITLCVAVMADGEGQQSIRDGIAAQHEQARLRELSAKKNGTAKLGDRRFATITGSFGEDFDGSYGEGDTSFSSTAASGSEFADEIALPAQAAGSGLTPQEMASLPPAQRDAYEAEVRKRRLASRPPAPTRQEITSLMNASAARSGSEAAD